MPLGMHRGLNVMLPKCRVLLSHLQMSFCFRSKMDPALPIQLCLGHVPVTKLV